MVTLDDFLDATRCSLASADIDSHVPRPLNKRPRCPRALNIRWIS